MAADFAIHVRDCNINIGDIVFYNKVWHNRNERNRYDDLYRKIGRTKDFEIVSTDGCGHDIAQTLQVIIGKEFVRLNLDNIESIYKAYNTLVNLCSDPPIRMAKGQTLKEFLTANILQDIFWTYH